MASKQNHEHCDDCSRHAADPHPIFDLCKEKRFDEALELCRQEIAWNPDHAKGYASMAGVLELMKDWNAALPYRNKMIEIMPEDPVGYFARAKLFYDKGDCLLAITDFTRSAAFDREQVLGPANFLYRADCHRRLGDYDKAVADCALVPDDYKFPGFLGQWEGTKHHLLAEIAQVR